MYGEDILTQIVILPNGKKYAAQEHFDPSDKTKYLHEEFLRELTCHCDNQPFRGHQRVMMNGKEMIFQADFDFEMCSNGEFPFDTHPMRLFDKLLSPEGKGEGFFSKGTGFSGVDYDAENGVLIFPDPRDGGCETLLPLQKHLV